MVTSLLRGLVQKIRLSSDRLKREEHSSRFTDYNPIEIYEFHGDHHAPQERQDLVVTGLGLRIVSNSRNQAVTTIASQRTVPILEYQ